MQWNKSVFSVQISVQDSSQEISFNIILRVVLLFTAKENKLAGGWPTKLELSVQLPNKASSDPQPVSVSHCRKIQSIISAGFSSSQQVESRWEK